MSDLGNLVKISTIVANIQSFTQQHNMLSPGDSNSGEELTIEKPLPVFTDARQLHENLEYQPLAAFNLSHFHEEYRSQQFSGFFRPTNVTALGSYCLPKEKDSTIIVPGKWSAASMY